ncbi:NAD-dependent epimerase/dehydratase family protein [Sphingopyxis sp. MWB1]|uniref:NAD-dependent epimerase/dehydratase family protein n=1 Tax=Sphingopyxis sp. MWB1 TaxID=1537715 RepID=UPI001186FA82
MTILVTGAAGFIGMHVTAALLARRERVIGIDNFSPYYSHVLNMAETRGLRLRYRGSRDKCRTLASLKLTTSILSRDCQLVMAVTPPLSYGAFVAPLGASVGLDSVEEGYEKDIRHGQRGFHRFPPLQTSSR